jgi:hypothetical protein
MHPTNSTCCKNVPPQNSNIIQRSTRTNKVPATNPKDKWLIESLKATMDAIERGIIFL